jgi:hypothetical protein
LSQFTIIRQKVLLEFIFFFKRSEKEGRGGESWGSGEFGRVGVVGSLGELG